MSGERRFLGEHSQRGLSNPGIPATNRVLRETKVKVDFDEVAFLLRGLHWRVLRNDFRLSAFLKVQKEGLPPFSSYVFRFVYRRGSGLQSPLN